MLAVIYSTTVYFDLISIRNVGTVGRKTEGLYRRS